MEFTDYAGRAFTLPNATDAQVPPFIRHLATDLPKPPPWLNRAKMVRVNGVDRSTWLQWYSQPTLRDRPDERKGSLTAQQGLVLRVQNVMTFNHPNGKAVQLNASAKDMRGKDWLRDDKGRIVAYAAFEYANMEIFNIYRTDDSTHTDAFWLGGSADRNRPTDGYVHDVFVHDLAGSSAVCLLTDGYFGTVVIQRFRGERVSRVIEAGGLGGELLVLDQVDGMGLSVIGPWKRVVVKNCANIKPGKFWVDPRFKGQVSVEFDDDFVVPNVVPPGGQVTPTPAPTPVPPIAVPVPSADNDHIESITVNFDDGRPPVTFVRKT